MTADQASIADQVEQVLDELVEAGGIRAGRQLVIGVSTSEVQGRHIGTSGTVAAAAHIYEGVLRVQQRIGFDIVWQCCEHLNRALVAERALAEAMGWTVVSAVPVPHAGGSMAAYAYRQLKDPCLVERVQVHAGLDIGETMIGMHLRPVAVPFRPQVRWIGEARVTAAHSRPKLIGGARAVYALPSEEASGNTCK